MKSWWNSLSIQYKIIVPVLLIVLASGAITYSYFTDLYHETETAALISKARVIVVVNAASTLAILLVVLVVARLIRTPIRAIELAAQRAAMGDFSHAASLTAGSDELGSLTKSFQTVIKNVELFHNELKEMTRQHSAGMISYVMPAEKFSGEFATIVRGVNNLVNAHIAVKMRVVDVITQYAVGNFTVDMDRLPGEKAKITKSIDDVKASLQGLSKEMQTLVESASQGNLSKRGDASKFQYTFADMVRSMNAMLDAIVQPTTLAASHIDSISRGVIPAPITQPFNGDFNALKTNINTLIETLNAFSAAQVEMARQHDAGMISYIMPTEKFSGEFATMVRGVNNLVNAHIAVKMRVVDVITQYAVGNFTVDMDRLPGEKAKITKSIDDVKANLKAINDEILMLAQAAVDGRLSVRGDTGKFQHTFREMVDGINRTLDAAVNPTREGVETLRSMAEGDLTRMMLGNYNGDHAALKNAVNSTLNSINTALGQVVATAEQVLQGSRQVSSASQSLSQGATEQAASLEEISSSMQEIASQTKLNAENANQANQLAAYSRSAADRGNDDMKLLIEAMNEINESSKNISRIIKVIDEIAFQTNLLALNAAVEAARAGRHGKGFAVVAEEVRNLAARSAKAAKETADMIEGAVRKAENGASLAQRTGEGLKEIVTGSTKVTDIVAEIAAASTEQAQGIAQINIGLGQIDKVTQQNTASAEECAAAAEELSGQVTNLNGMLTRFQLKDNAMNYSAMPTMLPNGHGSRSNGSLSAAHSAHSARVNDTSSNERVRTLMPHEIISLDDDDFGKY
jgi:methyl-accepting chemotaxis protein